MVVRTHDVILRYLRVRPGEESRGDDALEFYDAERCIADHCSLEWGDDETCSITGLSDAITIQNCIIAEGLNHEGHSMASICGGERTTWHHNLIAHCRTRNPRFADVATCDFRNNVVFNWGDTAAYGEFERVNLVNNWFKPGPSTTQQPPRFHIGETVVTPGTLFAKGNVMESRDEVTKDNWIGIGFPREVEAANPFEAPPVTTATAAEACQTVLAGAGATLPERDEIDARIVESVRTGSGRIIDRVRPEESGR
jgi:pectate lyase